jgi:hypothetical protein
LEILDELFDFRVDDNRDIKTRLFFKLVSWEDLQIEIVIGFFADRKFQLAYGHPVGGRKGRGGGHFHVGWDVFA